jgi:hypothetical protein
MSARTLIPVLALLLSAACNLSCAEEGRRSGASLFTQHCSGCHGLKGDGGSVTSGIPRFQDSVGAFSDDDGGRTYVLHVPGVANTNLDDEAIATVLNYLMTRWGGKSLPDDYRAFTRDEVARRRHYAIADVVALRRKVVARLRSRGITIAAYPWP